MYYLIPFAVLYFFRGRIATKVAPFLPTFTPQQVSFYGHSVTLFAGVLYCLPIEFLGLGGVKRVFYLICLWSVVLTSLMTIKANYGMPPMPEKLSFGAFKQLMAPESGLQGWLMKAMPSVDFNFLFLALIFVTAYPSMFVVGILGRRSLWSVCMHCAKTEGAGGKMFAVFKPRWEKLKAQEPQVLHVSALAEIFLAFWLTGNLILPTRQILTCFLYWNYLKTRYQSPRSSQLHEKAWMQLGSTVAPVLKVAPFLQKPIDLAKGWFKPQHA